MIQTVSLSSFRDAFQRADRASHFSYEGLRHLFDYLEEADSEYELDVIELCCSYGEETFEDFAKAECLTIEGMTEEQVVHEVMEYLQNNTCVVGCTASSVVYAYF